MCKRFALLCLFLLIFLPTAMADQPFQVDDIHTYDMMTRPYAADGAAVTEDMIVKRMTNR